MPTYLSDEDVFGKPEEKQEGSKYLSDVDVGLEAPQSSMAGDVAKSAGVGLGKGVIGLAGLPGDVAELGARGINAAVQGVGRLTGIDVGPSREAEEPTYGSQAIQKGVEEVTGPFYQPQTLPGKYAETISEFAPAVLGGPEGLATRALTRAVVPGVISETAGQVAEKVAPEYAPYARTVGALAAGLRPKSFTKYAVPTMKDLEGEGAQLYRDPEIAKVRISANAAHRELGDIKNDLERTVDPALMEGTWSRLNKEQSQHAPSQPGAMAALTGVKPTSKPDLTIDDLNTLRKQLSGIARDYAPSRRGEDRMAATIAIGKIDSFLDNLKQPDLTAGNAAAAVPKLRLANENWAAARRVETADKRIASALLRAGTFSSGQNVENKIRQTLGVLVDPASRIGQRLRAGWSDLELKRAEDIARGGEISNLLREVGNRLSPYGHYGGMILAAEEAARGNYGRAALFGIGLPAAARAVKGLGNVRTYQKAQGLSELLASRSPLARQWRAEGRMAPISPTGFAAGLGTYLGPAIRYTADRYPYIQGQMKGGRVVRSFRTQGQSR